MSDGLEKDKCPICKSSSANEERPNNNTYYINCQRCGHYFITNEAIEDNTFDQELSAKLSFWIRNNEHKKLTITNSIIETIRSLTLPNLKEQINNLIMYLGKNSYPGETFDTNLISIIPIVGSRDNLGSVYVLDYLRDNNFITIENIGSISPLREIEINNLALLLSYKGWELYEAIKQSPDIGKMAFMAMKYGNTQLENLYKDHLTTAVKQTGFDIQLLRDSLRAGSIDDQLRVQLRSAKFLLVDLTDDNNGAYWEAGYAEGLNKPVIYLCEDTKFKEFSTHFDTNHLTTVTWNINAIDEDMSKLKAVIRNTFPLEAKLED
jgi:hypothetical protein